MKPYTGTSGYSYKEWKGAFYPEDIGAGDMLRFYSSKLPSVEINNTFYRMPRGNVVESWAEQVPDEFRFSMKSSRRITHFKRLKEAQEELEYMLGQFRLLGERLGVVLFQLPPNFKQDVERLGAFLELVPKDIRAAFEFRHDSWFDDETYACLREHDRALCFADTEDGEVGVVSTANWGYVRLRRPDYSEEELTKWAQRVREQEWSEAYVFFKHEDDAGGPNMAARFLEL